MPSLDVGRPGSRRRTSAAACRRARSRLASTATGSMPCASSVARRRGRPGRPRARSTSPGVAAAGQRVDEDQRVVPVEQVVGEVHAADAVVDDADAVRQPAGSASRRTTSGPKPSSPRNRLPMPATRTVVRSSASVTSARILRYALDVGDRPHPDDHRGHAPAATTHASSSFPIDSHDRLSSRGWTRRRSSGSSSSGREVEVAAVPVVQVGRRVVDEHDGDVGRRRRRRARP